jgi:hypothetical protein
LTAALVAAPPEQDNEYEMIMEFQTGDEPLDGRLKHPPDHPIARNTYQ